MKVIKLILIISIFAASLVISPVTTASESITIRILTLDTRPPNNLFLYQLAAIAGINIEISFNAEDVIDADLVSLNTASAGSLVKSRTVDPWTLEPPAIREDALVHFALPRVEPTVTEKAIASDYGRIRNELQNAELQRKVFHAIKTDGNFEGDPLIAGYIDRIRGWIHFLSICDINPDRMLITLDDNRPGPLSDGLKILLGEFSFYVFDGTDEGMMLLLARKFREIDTDAPSTLPIMWTSPADLTSVRQFESGIVAENVLLMSRFLKMRITPNLEMTESYRPVLWIHGNGSSAEERPGLIADALYKIENRDVIVADTGELNGGDPILFQTWSEGFTPPGLIGYLGWNTSSNTIGSAIALWASIDFAYFHTSNPEGVRPAVELFLWSRILDDYFYQRKIRAERREYISSIGADQYNLTNEQSEYESAEISKRLLELWNESGVTLSIPFRIVEPVSETGFIVELPWNRLFEIELLTTDNRGILPTIHPVTNGNIHP